MTKQSAEVKLPVRLLLTPKEAAAALSICERTLWRLTDEGKIVPIRIGRLVRYDLATLQSWIEAEKTQASAPPAQGQPSPSSSRNGPGPEYN